MIADIKTKHGATYRELVHNLAEIQEICYAVAILNAASLRVQVGQGAHAGDRRGPYDVRQEASDAELALLKRRGRRGEVVVDTQNEYHVTIAPPEPDVRALIANWSPSSRRPGLVPRSVKEGASLEEKFLEVTKRA